MAFPSFALLSLLVSTVLAQSSSNPLIPSGISPACATYLTSLDSDVSLSACTQPFTNAFAQFSPGANATSLSAAAITNILQPLCSSNAFCPQNTVTTQLSSFFAACSAELTSAPNRMVQTTYDALYSLVPLSQAICSKDDSGQYCAANLSNTSSTGTVALAGSPQSQNPLSQYLYTSPETSGPASRRDLSNTTTIVIPNTTTFQATNLVFLFLDPSAPSSQLCTACTRNILTPYITFESNCPYAIGLSQSLLFGGQTGIYNSVTSACGSSFLSGAVQAAGGLSSGLMSGAAPRVDGQELSTAVSAILGVVALVAASL